MPEKNILLAMFDIKPIGESAAFVLSQIRREIDLRQKAKLAEIAKPPIVIEAPSVPVASATSYWDELIAKLPQRPDFPIKYELGPLSKYEILKEIEEAVSGELDIRSELATVGGRVHQSTAVKARPKFLKQRSGSLASSSHEVARSEDIRLSVLSQGSTPRGSVEAPVESVERPANSQLEDFWAANENTPPPQPEITPKPELVMASVHNSQASKEIEIWLRNIDKNRQLLESKHSYSQQTIRPNLQLRTKPKWSSWFRFNKKALVYIIGIALPGLLILGLVQHRGILARNNIIQNSNNAVANLQEAKQELKELNFIKAADSFALAYDDFNKASGTLSQLGASFLSVFGDLPGLNKVKAANNLVEAGQDLSEAGQNLSMAFGKLYETNPLSFLNSGSSHQTSLSEMLKEFKEILIFADQKVKRANRLLADIDATVLPEDKRELFLDFKEKIPEFQEYVGEAVDYSDFLLKFVGVSGTKTYLILLQNNSELRPTGGFPGTYGLMTFDDGLLKKIFIEDIYRADANLKTNIIPPVPLQHITPGWGMRDAAWFADFPASARKVMEFYKLDGGPNVDGVLAITPDVITKILDIIGPIDMPEYKLVLDSSNLLDALQNEVEYEADRSAPKQILSDLQPKFFERLAQQDKDHWLEIFKVITVAVKEKHILGYFNNQDLEEVAVKNGFGGEIKDSPSDYLQVVFSNIKGSKTDFVTDNSIGIETNIDDTGNINHELTISRMHNGGDSKYGFYNRDNSAYIKVYVPPGATMKGISGQSITGYRSLIGHDDFGFKKDPDLARIEDSSSRPFIGVDVFEESGKTVFGFWLIVKPKQTKSIVLKYQLPYQIDDGKYSLLWQKQSGTDQDRINFSFKIPDGQKVINQSAGFENIGDSLVLNSDLAEDRVIDITLH